MDCSVSVIIPAYNSEKFIERCLRGVLKHSADNIEIIVINDGSTDCTEMIVKDLAEKDQRIRLFSQPNAGVSAARNTGISKANGDYIVFCDADDVFEGENLNLLLNHARNTNADVVVFGRINHYPDGLTTALLPKNDLFSIRDNYEAAFKSTILNQNNFGWSSCNKLYKRSIILNNGLGFIDYKTVNSEDRLFNLSYFMYCSIVACFDKCSFHNYIREDSLSHRTEFPKAAERNVVSFNYVCEYAELLPENVRYKLLKHYFISFLNNVVVLDLSVNQKKLREVSLSFNEAYHGMNVVLINHNELDRFKTEKDIISFDNGLKYKVLNALILNNKLLLLAKAILFGYVKLTDAKQLFKTKRKGK